MPISSVTKDGGYLIIVEDGVTKRRSIVYEDTVCSLPPNGYEEVGVVYVDAAAGTLIIQYNGNTIEVAGDLTGDEIVALLEALDAGSRLSHTKLDDVGASDHHARYLDSEAVTAAKTVKLDDFTAPDDNTDLDADGGVSHGLMPKTDKTKLDTVATNADVTGSNAPQAHEGSHASGGSDDIDSPLAMAAMPVNIPITTITFIIDGGGSAITTGIKGALEIPFACTINRVTLLGDQSGSIVIDIWKQAYADYPPEDAQSITASAVPTISGDTDSQDSTLSGWTAAIAAGDCLIFNVDSITSFTWITLSLKVTKT